MKPGSMDSGILRERLRALLGAEAPAGSEERLTDLLAQVRSEDIAEVLADFPPDEKLQLFLAVPGYRQPEVLDETDETSTRELIENLPAAILEPLLSEMPPDEVTDLLEMLPESRRASALETFDPARAADVRELLHHEPESAGGIMTSEFVVARADDTCREIRKTLEQSHDAEVISYVYVTDDQRILTGVLSIRDVLGSSSSEVARDLMEVKVITVNVDDDQEEVANVARKYNLNSIPVVDDFGRLLGVATIDDIVDVISDEADEDIYRLAGTSGDHPTQRRLIERMRERIGWLVISVIGGLAVGYVQLQNGTSELVLDAATRLNVPVADLQAFLDSILNITALLPWTPLVMGVSGAAGIQVATLLTRGIATGEIDLSRTAKVVGQEITIGAVIAIFYGTAAFFVLLAADHFAFDLHSRIPLAVGVGLVLGVLLATFSGSLLPIVCNMIGIDPALVSGPFITALNDLVASVCYLTVGEMILHG